jgi:TRAP transporter TAXI family solute receptor
MKKITSGFLVVLAGLLAGGLTLICLSETSGQPPSPAAKMPERLIWFTMMPGSQQYPCAVGITQLINQYSNLKVIVRPYPRTIAGQAALHQKAVDLGDSTLSNAYHSCYGIKSTVHPEVQEAWPELRMLMAGDPMWWGWMTRPDTGIKTIQDLKGHTVNYDMPGQAVKTAAAEATLRAVGINPAKDLKHIGADNPPAALKMLGFKKIDAVFAPFRGSTVTEVSATTGIVFLPSTPETYKAMIPEAQVTHVLKELPAGYIKGMDKPQYVLGFIKLVACREDLYEEAAYVIVKTIMEHARELDQVGPDFKEWGVKEYALSAEFAIPVHPGAIRYFKEAGMWTPAHEARQKERLAKLPK